MATYKDVQIFVRRRHGMVAAHVQELNDLLLRRRTVSERVRPPQWRVAIEDAMRYFGWLRRTEKKG
ncbi:hypothetical protein [Ralstonia solanacearum]|uniref:hypothetical protein n=1 Tax=Ralstonia solanacearum TaxID=305 RepID=UPI003D804564